MSGAEYTRLQNTSRRELYYTTTLIAPTASETGAWSSIYGADNLYVYRSNTGGTYSLEFDWSRDGSTALFTETITTSGGGRSTPVQTISPYVRVRVRNTSVSAAFTAHTTVVWTDGS